MFEGSRAYYNSFDEWKPYGTFGDLKSDTGFSGLVADPLEAHGREMQFAGDALMNYASTVGAKQTADTNVEVSEILKEKAESGGGGGGGGASGGGGSMWGGIGGTAGGILGTAVGGPIGGAIGSTAGKLLGGLFG